MCSHIGATVCCSVHPSGDLGIEWCQWASFWLKEERKACQGDINGGVGVLSGIITLHRAVESDEPVNPFVQSPSSCEPSQQKTPRACLRRKVLFGLAHWQVTHVPFWDLAPKHSIDKMILQSGPNSGTSAPCKNHAITLRFVFGQ